MKISSWWNLTPDPTDSSRGWFLSLDWGTLGSTLDRVLMISAVWRFMLWLITEGGLVEAGEGLTLLGVRVLVFMYRDGSLRVIVVVTDPIVDDAEMTTGVIVVTLTTGTGVESFVIVNTVVSSTRS